MKSLHLALLGTWRICHAEANNQAGGHRGDSGRRNHRPSPGVGRHSPARSIGARRHSTHFSRLWSLRCPWFLLEPAMQLADLSSAACSQVMPVPNVRAYPDSASLHVFHWRIWTALAQPGLPGLGPRPGLFRPGPLRTLRADLVAGMFQINSNHTHRIDDLKPFPKRWFLHNFLLSNKL